MDAKVVEPSGVSSGLFVVLPCKQKGIVGTEVVVPSGENPGLFVVLPCKQEGIVGTVGTEVVVPSGENPGLFVVLPCKQEDTVGTEAEVPSGESSGLPRVPSTEKPWSRSEQCVACFACWQDLCQPDGNNCLPGLVNLFFFQTSPI